MYTKQTPKHFIVYYCLPQQYSAVAGTYSQETPSRSRHQHYNSSRVRLHGEQTSFTIMRRTYKPLFWRATRPVNSTDCMIEGRYCLKRIMIDIFILYFKKIFSLIHTIRSVYGTVWPAKTTACTFCARLRNWLISAWSLYEMSIKTSFSLHERHSSLGFACVAAVFCWRKSVQYGGQFDCYSISTSSFTPPPQKKNENKNKNKKPK